MSFTFNLTGPFTCIFSIILFNHFITQSHNAPSCITVKLSHIYAKISMTTRILRRKHRIHTYFITPRSTIRQFYFIYYFVLKYLDSQSVTTNFSYFISELIHLHVLHKPSIRLSLRSPAWCTEGINPTVTYAWKGSSVITSSLNKNLSVIVCATSHAFPVWSSKSKTKKTQKKPKNERQEKAQHSKKKKKKKKSMPQTCHELDEGKPVHFKLFFLDYKSSNSRLHLNKLAMQKVCQFCKLQGQSIMNGSV